MSIAIFRDARTANQLAFEVCPNATVTGTPPAASVVCNEPRDAAGNPVPPHPVFQFPSQVPAGDPRTPRQWAIAHAHEARLLVAAAQATTPQVAGDLVGLTV